MVKKMKLVESLDVGAPSIFGSAKFPSWTGQSGLAALVDKILQVRDLNKDRCFRLVKVHYNSSYKYHKATEVI